MNEHGEPSLPHRECPRINLIRVYRPSQHFYRWRDVLTARNTNGPRTARQRIQEEFAYDALLQSTSPLQAGLQSRGFHASERRWKKRMFVQGLTSLQYLLLDPQAPASWNTHAISQKRIAWRRGHPWWAWSSCSISIDNFAIYVRPVGRSEGASVMLLRRRRRDQRKRGQRARQIQDK